MTHALPLNQVLNDRYRILQVLGQSGFGITYLAENTLLGSMVCIKELFVWENSTRGTDQKVHTQAKSNYH